MNDENPQIAFHKNEFVVIASPSPDAFWLAQALTDVHCVDTTTTSAMMLPPPGPNQQQTPQQLSGISSSDGQNSALSEPASLFTSVRFLERVASFENGDDLYRVWKDEQVRKMLIVCSVKLEPRYDCSNSMDKSPIEEIEGNGDSTQHEVKNAGEPRQFVLTLAERHRIISFLANTYGSDTPAEGVLSDGLGVSSIVSSARFNNSAFLLVKWAGLDCAMTWEPRELIEKSCPDLLEHLENAPYKLAISFPPQQPQPIFESPEEQCEQQSPRKKRAAVGSAASPVPVASTPTEQEKKPRKNSSASGRGRGRGRVGRPPNSSSGITVSRATMGSTAVLAPVATQPEPPYQTEPLLQP